MAQAFRSATVGSIAGSPLVINAPAGVIDADILVLVVTTNTTGVVGNPSGWTLLHTQSLASAGRHQVWWKKAASEPASYSIGLSAANSCGGIMAISGCRDVIDVESLKSNIATASLLGTAITTTDSNEILIWIASRNTVGASGAITKPANQTSRNPSLVYAGGSILTPTFIMATELFVGPGTTVAGDMNGSLTGSNTANSAVSLITFKSVPDAQPLLFCEA